MGRLLVFYYLQAELGEDVRHPNVFEIEKSSDSIDLTLGEVLKHFPLQSSGDFHWRFRTTLHGRKDYVWVDITKASDRGK